MPEYRIYKVGRDGHLFDFPNVVMCDNDQHAIEKAQGIALSFDVEVWHGEGRVTRITTVQY